MIICSSIMVADSSNFLGCFVFVLFVNFLAAGDKFERTSFSRLSYQNLIHVYLRARNSIDIVDSFVL